MFDNSGNLLTYEQFLSTYSFPVQFREFNSVIKAIPVTLCQLVKSHICYNYLCDKPKLNFRRCRAN